VTMTKTVNNRQAVISKIHDVGSMWMDEMWDTRLEDGGWSSLGRSTERRVR
jgi:hypothetical protein